MRRKLTALLFAGAGALFATGCEMRETNCGCNSPSNRRLVQTPSPPLASTTTCCPPARLQFRETCGTCGQANCSQTPCGKLGSPTANAGIPFPAAKPAVVTTPSAFPVVTPSGTPVVTPSQATPGPMTPVPVSPVPVSPVPVSPAPKKVNPAKPMPVPEGRLPATPGDNSTPMPLTGPTHLPDANKATPRPVPATPVSRTPTPKSSSGALTADELQMMMDELKRKLEGPSSSGSQPTGPTSQAPNLPTPTVAKLPGSPASGATPSGATPSGATTRGERVVVMRASEVVHGATENYDAVTGLVYHFKNQVYLRYSTIDSEDRFGGSVQLVGGHAVTGLKEGQCVRVRGTVSAPSGADRAMYRVTEVHVFEEDANAAAPAQPALPTSPPVVQSLGEF